MKNNKGQAILLVLLSMAVVLTIVLSIVARSVTDIAVSTKEDESLKAFSAAEAGIEKSLQTGLAANGTFGSTLFSSTVTGATETSQEVANPVAIASGESLDFWFVGHDGNGALTCTGTTCFTGDKFKVCWGNPGTPASSSTAPAVEVSVIYAQTPGNYSTLQIARAGIDPNSARRTSNNFSADDGATCSIAGTSFAFSKTVTLGASGVLNIPSGSYTVQNGLQYMKVRILYNTDSSHFLGATTLGLVSSDNNLLFPPQGITIASTGTSGDATRKVQVFQGFGDTPEVFDSAVYSPASLAK